MGIKFDDEVQALLLISSLPNSWSLERLQQLPVQRDPIDSLLRRFVISFLERTLIRRRSSGEFVDQVLLKNPNPMCLMQGWCCCCVLGGIWVE